MAKHEFYADPTVFDHWHSAAQEWFCSRFGKLCPYTWSMVFLFAAITCVLIGATVFSNLLLQALSGQAALGWNHVLAQALTVVIALTVSQAPFTLALKAWPGTALPKTLARVAGARGLLAVGPASGTRVPTPTPTAAPTGRPIVRPTAREAAQAFFVEVRRAGINVAIARSLFQAGIRSEQQLLSTPDSVMLKIHGVGPATLHRLRTRFGACSTRCASGSRRRA